LARPFASDVDIAVVRISNEAQATVLQFPVEVVQEQVR